MGKARDRRLAWLSRKLLPKGDYYNVSNYGWGDGGCDGPFTAYEALLNYRKKYDWDMTPEKYSEKYGVSLIKQLKDAMSDRTMIHYISDYDESDTFDFMSS